MKKKKKGSMYQNDTKKAILLFAMIICIIIAMITYWIYAYHHKYGRIYFDNGLASYKVSDYVKVEGNTVYLTNIDREIINAFLDDQEEITSNNEVLNVDITKGLYHNILSVMISYTLAGGLADYEEVLAINVDIRENKVLTSEEMLSVAGLSYKSLAESIFDEYVRLPSDSERKVTDAITSEEMTSAEFNDNSEKYIIRIREKLPDITNVYISDGKVYAAFRLSEIDKLCYYTNTDIRLVNIKKEIGKI